jgi:uncharacterized membrane protein YphA (DoxX/SURF4 family)
MSLAAKLRRAPLRLATGAFILNAGVGKLSADEGTAQYLHGAGAGAYPVLKKLEPSLFAKVLAISEISVGTALLLPIIPAGLAGLALIGFSGALVGMYIRTPAMHDKYLRPNQAGTVVAKDVWMLGTGIALVVDAALSESPITATE